MRIKGIRRVREYPGGTVRWKYHRATGIPLPADLDETHPDFIAAFNAAEASGKPAPRTTRSGSVKAVWIALVKSETWKNLSPGYRRQMRIDGEKIVEKGGTVPFAQIRRDHIKADLRGMEGHAAVRRWKCWGLLCAHAIDMGLIEESPRAQIPKPKTAAATQRAPWTPEEIEAFRKHWPLGSKQRLAFELMHWTGARVNDAFRLGPGMVDRQGWLVFTQSKTGGEVSIPFKRDVPPFADRRDLEQLHAAIAAQPDRHMVWLATNAGHGRSEKSASMWFSKAVREAGIAEKTAHGLRVSRAVDLAERGATTHQIGAWTGHKSLDEIAHYSQRADKRRLLSGTDGDRPSVQKLRP